MIAASESPFSPFDDVLLKRCNGKIVIHGHGLMILRKKYTLTCTSLSLDEFLPRDSPIFFIYESEIHFW